MERSTGTPVAFRFALFEVDLQTAELRKRGRKVPLQDQPFKVLVILLRSGGQVVAREELQRALWPEDTFGDFDEGLNKAIQKLRQALDDSSDSPRFIETLPRKGYRFIAPTEAFTEPAAPTGLERPFRRREMLAWVLFAIAALALAAMAVIHFRPQPGPTHAVRFQIPWPAGAQFMGRVQSRPTGGTCFSAGSFPMQ